MLSNQSLDTLRLFHLLVETQSSRKEALEQTLAFDAEAIEIYEISFSAARVKKFVVKHSHDYHKTFRHVHLPGSAYGAYR